MVRDEQEGKREMEEQARKLYEDYEAAKLRVQLDEHLTKVEKEREITRLSHELQEEQERAAKVRWEIIAGFEAREASEGGSVKLEPEGD
jgi:polyphosphate kinase 2 (PPK2 family)